MTAATAAMSQLTDEQRRAIEGREVSIALSAGAGCGKTHVLTERFLSHLDPARPRPARLSELVAITFTDRAAREMRDRIRKSCHRRLLAAEDDRQADHWLSLIRELQSARVSTIHSFCGSLLRSHAVEAGLDPHFFTLEQNQASTLLAEVLDDQLRRLLMDRLPAAMDLVVQFSLNGLRSRLYGLLARAHQIDFAAWRSRSPDEIVQIWQEFHAGVVLPTQMRKIGEHSATARLQDIVARHEPNHAVMRARCLELARLLPGLSTSDSPADDLKQIRENAMVQHIGARYWPSEEAYAEFKVAAKELRDEIDKVYKKVAFDPAAARLAAVLGLQLLEVAEPVVAAYARRKRELGCLDFDDLLVRARDLLRGDGAAALRKSLSSQIELLLVDEFQDTDPLQVELVRAICDGQVAQGKLFFVGDYKQSIYRFRRADPQVFRALNAEMPASGRLPLTRNFRSQPAILSFVNALFCQHLGDDYQPLSPHRTQISPRPAVEFLWAPSDAAAVEKENVAQMRAREAEWIARRLRAILDGQAPLVWDREAELAGRPAARPARPGDIAILFRALSDVALYEETLRRHEIPYYLVGGHAFYAQQEIFDLLNLLRAIDSECDEVSLVGVLRSPYFCLSDETLFWLAQLPTTADESAEKNVPRLSSGLFSRTLPPQLDAAQRRRVEFAAATLKQLRDKKDRVPIAELLGEAVAATGYDATLAAEFLGERKLANLHKLIDQARSFDSSAIFTLSDFIAQLSEFVVNEPKEPLAATHPEATDVVKLMTIHMAKGLEFPLVVVPDLTRRVNNLTAPVAFHATLGPLVKPLDDGQSPRGACGLDLHHMMEAAEDEAELLRLFYVATTRAADYLMLSSSVVDLHKPDGPWMSLLAQRFALDSGQLLATLPSGYATPEVRVTTSEPPLAASTAARTRRPSLDELADRARHLAATGDVRQPRFAEPIPADAVARRQFSFSRLNGMLHLPQSYSEALEPERLPLFTVQVDALGLGTLVHAVLAELPFGQPIDVSACVARHAARHLADNATAAEARALIARFLESPRATQLATSRRRHAELEFLLAWPTAEAAAPAGPRPPARRTRLQRQKDATLPLFADEPPVAVETAPSAEPAPAGPTAYLQGFLDMLYQDSAGDWHLLDYKTNQVDAAGVPSEAQKYEMQMLVYALAVERILGQPPASIVLHFLRPGVEQTFTLDAAARRKLHDLVNHSIAAFVAQV